jgi:uncharacterized protein
VKYLLVLLVILVVAWRWRTSRSATFSDKAQKANRADQARANATPIPMLQCAHCGTHLPEQDAVAGRKGHYCSVQHRALSEP